jgi:hypothetical protein
MNLVAPSPSRMMACASSTQTSRTIARGETVDIRQPVAGTVAPDRPVASKQAGIVGRGIAIHRDGVE